MHTIAHYCTISHIIAQFCTMQSLFLSPLVVFGSRRCFKQGTLVIERILHHMSCSNWRVHTYLGPFKRPFSLPGGLWRTSFWRMSLLLSFPLQFHVCSPLFEELCTGHDAYWQWLPRDCRRRNQWQPGCTMHRIHLDDCCLFHSFMRHARCECRHFCAEEKGAFWLMLVIRVSKAALALTHDIHGTSLTFCHIPRWSSGQDFALSPRRPGFDSPSGNV